MIIINLFGSPGAGKSTAAAYIFSQLKMRGINCELVTEFAKDKVYEKSVEVFKNQAYIFGKQYFKITRCKDQVDVIITDSPLLLTMFYNSETNLDIKEKFDAYVLSIFNSLNNKNYFLNRVAEYKQEARFQNEEESNQIAKELKNLLNQYNISYSEYDGCKEDLDKIIQDILNKI